MSNPDPTSLPVGWFTFIVADGVDCDRPGVYEWKIDGVGFYIGKYNSISRPRRAYGLNVTRLLNDKPYRKGKPDQYRRIHRELAEAIRHGRHVTLTILENPPQHEINQRERELIAERGTLNGPMIAIGTDPGPA